MKKKITAYDKYKLLDEGKKHFILQHPDGETFTVAKPGLSEDHHQAIRALKVQHFDEGGDVQPVPDPTEGIVPASYDGGAPSPVSADYQPDSANPDRAPSSSLGEVIGKYGIKPLIQSGKDLIGSYGNMEKGILGFGSDIAKGAGLSSSPSAPPPSADASGQMTNASMTTGDSPQARMPDPRAAAIATAGASAALADPFGAGTDYQKAYAQMKSGILGEAGAKAAEGNKAAAVLDDAITQQQAVKADYDARIKAVQDQTDKDEQAFRSGQIDPNRKWNSMGTGNKIGAAIAMALGGLAGGLLKTGGNVAVDMINKSIANDIDAQKTNLTKSHSLVQLDNQKLNSLHGQMLEEYNQKLSQAKIMVESAAAKAQGPLAQAHAQQLLGQLGMQQAQIRHQMVLQQMQFQNADPITKKIEMLLPEKEREGAYKELGEYNSKQKALSQVDDIYGKYNQLQTVANRVGSPMQSKKQVDALNASLVQTIMEASPSKRLTKESVEQEIEPFQVKLTDSADTRLAKLQQIKNVIHTNAAPTPRLSGMGWVSQDSGPPKFNRK